MEDKKPNCEHGINDLCCCTCMHQKKLMCHPSNKTFGNGSIKEQCGYICNVTYEDNSNIGEVLFSDNQHGMCELWWPKANNEEALTKHLKNKKKKK